MAYYLLSEGDYLDEVIFGFFQGPEGVDLPALLASYLETCSERKLGNRINTNAFVEFVKLKADLVEIKYKELNVCSARAQLRRCLKSESGS
jgi:hypothetical protein